MTEAEKVEKMAETEKAINLAGIPWA